MRDAIIRRLGELSKTLALALGLLAALVILAHWRYGSLHAALAVWGGEPISVDWTITSLGKVESGMKVYRVVKLRNHSGKPVRIVGSMTTCTCVVPDELPITIPAHGAHQLQVLVNVPDINRTKDGVIDQSIDLLTSVPTQPALPLRITGEVVVHPAPSG
jgi:hypothetical protein